MPNEKWSSLKDVSVKRLVKIKIKINNSRKKRQKTKMIKQKEEENEQILKLKQVNGMPKQVHSRSSSFFSFSVFLKYVLKAEDHLRLRQFTMMVVDCVSMTVFIGSSPAGSFFFTKPYIFKLKFKYHHPHTFTFLPTLKIFRYKNDDKDDDDDDDEDHHHHHCGHYKQKKI